MNPRRGKHSEAETIAPSRGDRPRWNVGRRLTTAGELAVFGLALAGATFDAVADDGSLLQTWRGHLTAAVVGSIALAGLRSWNWRSIGARVAPLQGWWYWVRIGLLAVIGAVILGAVHLWQLGTALTAPEPVRIDRVVVVHLVLVAPLLEEVVYRLLVCSIAVPVVGAPAAIVASGVVFAGTHYLGGNFDPVNLVAGFFFAWCFLRSGSILVPVLFHTAGNALAMVVNVALAHRLG